MRVAVIGAGAVGARAARQLLSTPAVTHVSVYDSLTERAVAAVASLGPTATAATAPTGLDADAVVIAAPAGLHAVLARELIAETAVVVSVSDAMADVEALLDLGPEARERGATIAVAAGFSPGFTCVLARHAAASFDEVDEIHVARVGTGGPSCARQHHAALSGTAIDWRDGGWMRRSAGSGRELCWFPDPIGGADCYRAALPDALLLVPAFPGVRRVTARMAANRRDRLTSRFPMLRRPHAEGGPGAVRVEVRGRRGVARGVYVLGAMDRPAVGAGVTAAVTAVTLASGTARPLGAAGLATLLDPLPFLAELSARGVKAAVFDGEAQMAAS